VGAKFGNRICSRVRVVVAHISAGVKRCRRGKEVLRLTTEGIAEVVMEIACGLPNLRVSCRHPWLARDLLSWVNSS
jgi:hypothetical protein